MNFRTPIRAIALSVGLGWLSACQVFQPKTASRTTDSTQVVAQTDSVPEADSAAVADRPATDTATSAAADTVPVWAAKKGDYHPERTKKNDLLHTKLDVRFDWGKQHLIGVATLTLKPYFYPQSQLLLNAKGFDVRQVQLMNEKTKAAAPLKYTYDGKILEIALDKTYTRDQPYVVQIDYTAKPNELPKGGSQAITSDKGLYFINPDGADTTKPRQIWTQGETEASSCWFPTIDTPNERCTQEMYITVDSNFTTLSNGSLVYSRENKDGTKTDYWKQDKPHAPYLFMMAVGEFAVVNDTWQDKEVNYYVEPAYARYAKSIFGRTPEMIEFFSKRFNYPYPWDKYAQVVVRDFVSGAMENTTASVFMEDLQVDDRQLLDDNWDGIIAHELFHHWFGDLVTCESWANLPLNESFANYSEYLWAEHKYGKDEADLAAQGEADQYFAESAEKQEPLIRYYYTDKEDMFDSHSYAKGGRILHMLRKYVGDEAFFLALSNYLKKHAFSDVEIHDLRLAFEDVTGEDMNWFFNQWFLSAGHPELQVRHRYADGKVMMEVKQLQNPAYTPVYRLPLKVDVWVGSTKTRHSIDIREKQQTIELPATAAPDLVLFDADAQLLAKVDHPKTPPELAFQYANGETYAARYEALTKLTGVLESEEEDSSAAAETSPEQQAVASQLAAKALNDPFWKLRQLAVQYFAEYAGADSTQIEQQLKKMATTDPRSYVRAEAIGTLATWEGKNYVDVYRQGMQDKSYAVVAASLYAYLNAGAPDSAEKIAQFKDYPSTDVAIVIADYYAERAPAEAYDWFAHRLATGSNAEKYQITQLFGKYLLRQPQDVQMNGVKTLEKMARQSDAYYVRFAAYQTLGFFAELAGVKEMRADIRAKETDEKLRNLYEMVP